jgi:hypothetical protein
MATRSPREETRTARADPNAPGADQAQASERAAVIREERKKRVPLGVPRTKLTVPTRPGYQRRWINDDAKGRLQHALKGVILTSRIRTYSSAKTAAGTKRIRESAVSLGSVTMGNPFVPS